MCECLTYAEGGRYYCEACESEVKDLEDALLDVLRDLNAGNTKGRLVCIGPGVKALRLLAVRNRVTIIRDTGETVIGEEIKTDEA